MRNLATSTLLSGANCSNLENGSEAEAASIESVNNPCKLSCNVVSWSPLSFESRSEQMTKSISSEASSIASNPVPPTANNAAPEDPMPPPNKSAGASAALLAALLRAIRVVASRRRDNVGLPAASGGPPTMITH